MTTTTTPKARTRPSRMTRKRQHTTSNGDGFTSAQLVAALETAWTAIRSRHPEVPAAVVVVGSGTSSRQAKYGHYAAMRWQHGTDRLPEVLISGEGLQRPATEVLTTLLHEAAHGLADTRGIKDTSRQGRWHNQKFKTLADELGLDASKDPKLGWSPCTLRDSTADTYTAVLDQLTAALLAYRHPEITSSLGRKNNNALACSCGCPRRIRVAKAVLELGPISCGLCDHDFEPDTNTGA